MQRLLRGQDSCPSCYEPLSRFIRRIPSGKFEPALGPATLCALAVETDDSTGLARRVAPVRLGGRLQEARPAFWE